ncbi:MAG: CBU_0592 family membrane protein [Allosphingosinicella sp.]
MFPPRRHPALRAAEPRSLSGTELFVEVAGWAGASFILGAYLLLSMGKTTGQSPLYQGMNIVGAAGFIVNGWWHGAIPSAALNVLWLAIGAVALWRIHRRRATRGRET